MLNKLEGTSLIKKSDCNNQWVLNDKFSRDVVPISMSGRNSAYSSGIVFKFKGRLWKYTNISNMVAYFVNYETVLLNNPYFFDLTLDPYETTNLIDSATTDIQAAVTFGISLLQQSFTEGAPSLVDTVSQVYVL